MSKRAQFKYLDYTSFFRYIDTGHELTLKKRILIRFLTPEYVHTHWRVKCNYAKSKKDIFHKLYHLYCRFRYYRLSTKYGIIIPPSTKIGLGFFISHFGTIVIHSDAVIGDNCSLCQGVTIGRTNRGKRQGTPTIGNNVYIGPGAKIIGNVKVGNNVAIGTNAVVTKDIPDNAVVVGAPARVISYEGSSEYVLRTDYKTWEEWSD